MADKKIRHLDRDMNIIAKLDDEPNDVGGLSSADLKAKFDDSGNVIKTYLNEILIPDIEGTGPDAPGIIGEDIKKHNEAPDSHADIRDEIAQNKRTADAHIANKENPHGVTAEQIGALTAIPQATAEALGGVKADPATEEDTQPIHIKPDGTLATQPGKNSVVLTFEDDPAAWDKIKCNLTGDEIEAAMQSGKPIWVGNTGAWAGTNHIPARIVMDEKAATVTVMPVESDRKLHQFTYVVERATNKATYRETITDLSGSIYATCADEAASPTSQPNTWYVSHDSPRPSGNVGMMVDVFWKNGRTDGIGYDVSLVWGAPGGAGNEVIVGPIGTSESLSGEYSIPAEGTVRYQLIEQSGRMRWQYVSGKLIPKQFSSATAAATADKAVPGMEIEYLPGMEIYLQMDNGNTAQVMRLVPDAGPTLPAYGNGTGAKTGDIPAGYILHLVNAGDHWQIINQYAAGGDGGKSPLVVTVDREGAGGYKADYNSSDILAAAQAHRAVIMRYTDTDSGLQTDILLKGEKAGLPLFYDTWLSKDGKTVNRIDATVDYGSNVNVTQSSVPAGAQSDWNVNDSADPAFVKNRPFYVSEETGENVVFSEQQVTFGDLGAPAPGAQISFAAETGKTYVVYIDGTAYQSVGAVLSTPAGAAVGIGNLKLMGGDDTGEPFIILTQSGATLMLLVGGTTNTIKIAVVENIVIPIPDKFLPVAVKFSAGLKKGHGEIFNDYVNNVSDGKYSHAGGNRTKAMGFASFASGSGCEANGNYSAVFGDGNITAEDCPNQFMVGHNGYSYNHDGQLFIVGCGSEDSRYNSFSVGDNGVCWVGRGIEIGGPYKDAPINNGTAKLDVNSLTLTSTTPGSMKRFRISVDDTGNAQVKDENTGDTKTLLAVPAGGNAGQFLVSDGAGGAKWATIPAAKGVGF